MASKEQVPAQDAESVPETEFQVPLDLLCDMAWRIARANSTRPVDTSAWCDAVREAYFLIRAANELREGMHENARPNPYVVDAEKKIRSLATEDEFLEQHFTFERGCQLITGKRKAEATNLFRRACERGHLPIRQERLKDLETNGFPWEDMASLRAAFLGVRKPELRKNKAKE